MLIYASGWFQCFFYIVNEPLVKELTGFGPNRKAPPGFTNFSNCRGEQQLGTLAITMSDSIFRSGPEALLPLGNRLGIHHGVRRLAIEY